MKAGKIVKIEPLKSKALRRYVRVPLGLELCKNSQVLFKNVIDSADILPVIGLKTVVIEAAPTLIGAELFIGPALQRGSAGKAGFRSSVYHITQRVW